MPKTLRGHWNAVVKCNVPPVWTEPVNWDYPESEFIILLCRSLQIVSGDKVFILKHKSLAEIIGHPEQFVNMQLEILELDGFIFRTFRGTKGRASEYRYIAKEIPDKFKSHRDIVSKLQKG